MGTRQTQRFSSVVARGITILTHDPRWKGIAPTIKRAVEAVLVQQRVKKSSVTVVLSNDVEVQALNHQYRRKNKPTNVLSFPDGSIEGGITQLGDCVLAYETLVREADAQSKPLKAHLSHLAIHGVLHLLGHDHVAEDEAHAMESIEISILKRMGIANPYESA